MSDRDAGIFTKENLDLYLRELAKEYRKLGGKTMSAEIILVGGAAVLANYGFRSSTVDIDAVISSASTLKEAVTHVADKHNLPDRWLNSDFTHTASFAPGIIEHSSFYKKFYGCIEVRCVKPEYLVAMKLRSGRPYKHDISDIIGILHECNEAGTPLSMESVENAYTELYGSLESMPEYSAEIFNRMSGVPDYQTAYRYVKEKEADVREALLLYEKNHPGSVTESDVDSILSYFASADPERLSFLQKLSGDEPGEDLFSDPEQYYDDDFEL